MSTNSAASSSRSTSTLSVEGLTLAVKKGGGSTEIVSNVSFKLEPGKITGLAGESGSGKTVTSLACMGLLQGSGVEVESGGVYFDGADVLSRSREDMRRMRGSQVSMVFQEPMVSLDPNFTVGAQLVEVIQAHQRISGKKASAHALDLLTKVGIPEPERRFGMYPFELSGGQLQRILIAMAVSNSPQVLIADEPTTALDVTVQAQIMDLLRGFADQGMTVLLVTHDLGVMAEYADDLIVMYAGQVVEKGPTRDVLLSPRHPYTEGLVRSVPSVTERRDKLSFIPGRVPQPKEFPLGCRFAERCSYAIDSCSEPVELQPIDPDRAARCLRKGELTLEGVVEEYESRGFEA